MLLRVFVALALLFASSAAPGQTGTMPRIGVLANTIPLRDLIAGSSTHPAPGALVEGLRSLGWAEGRNVRFVWRSAEGDLARLPALAEELVREPVDVIVAYGPGVEAAMKATDRIPIVMATSGETGRLVLDGKVRIESLARPGGNITGLTLAAGSEFNGKRLALLKQAAPSIQRVAFLAEEPATSGPRTRAAAEALGLTLHAYGFGNGASDLDATFAQMARDRMDAAVIAELPVTNLAPTQLAIHRLGERYRLAILHEVLGAADSGGLMAYGHDINRLYKRAPFFVDRILRGTKAGAIPIEQPSDFELRVNLNAARATGLVIPQPLLLQATRVIE